MESQNSATRAQGWLDKCIESDERVRQLADRVRVGIGLGSTGLYVGVTWLPGTVNGVSLSRDETSGLSDLLLYAADAIRREEER